MTIFAETERLILRDWEEADIPSFVQMNADKRVMEFFLKTLSEEESLAMLATIKAEIETSGFGFFAVERKDDHQFIGAVGLHTITFDIDFAPAIEISWRLLHKYWGSGYAPEAANACFQFAKKELSIPEIVSFTSLPNINSQRVMRKLGMEFVKEFDHPSVPANHPLLRHVLYRKDVQS